MSEKPSLAKLMQSMGLPGLTKAEQARAITLELAARTFAATYLQTFNVKKAYQAIRPNAKASGKKTGERAAQMLANHRVQQLIAGTLGPKLEKAELDCGALVERISEDMDSTLDKFYNTNEVGEVVGFRIKPSELTEAQRRSIRGIKIKDGKIVGIDLVDSQRAQALAMQLVALMRAMNQGGESGTIPGELTKALEDVGKKREAYTKRLPPPRVRALIEGEFKQK